MKKEESLLVRITGWGIAVLVILFLMELTADLWLLKENLAVRYALNHEFLARAEKILESSDLPYGPGIYYEPLISAEEKSRKKIRAFLLATRLRIRVSLPKGGDLNLKRVILSLENAKIAPEMMPKAQTLYLCSRKDSAG